MFNEKQKAVEKHLHVLGISLSNRNDYASYNKTNLQE